MYLARLRDFILFFWWCCIVDFCAFLTLQWTLSGVNILLSSSVQFERDDLVRLRRENGFEYRDVSMFAPPRAPLRRGLARPRCVTVAALIVGRRLPPADTRNRRRVGGPHRKDAAWNETKSRAAALCLPPPARAAMLLMFEIDCCVA